MQGRSRGQEPGRKRGTVKDEDKEDILKKKKKKGKKTATQKHPQVQTSCLRPSAPLCRCHIGLHSCLKVTELSTNQGRIEGRPPLEQGRGGQARHPVEGGFLPELIGQTRARRGERAAVFKLCRGHRSLSIPGTFSWESTALGFLRVTGLSKHGLDLVLRAMAENKRLSKHRDSGVDEELGGGPGPAGGAGPPLHLCVLAPELGPPCTPGVLCSLHAGRSKTLHSVFPERN